MTDHSMPPEGERRGRARSMGKCNCAQVREEAAVALLVHGDPPPEVLAHLEGCPPCRDEYLDLAALPPLLNAARTVAGSAPAPVALPSVHLLDRLLSEVARRRRRRHLITALATAAAVLAIIVPAARLFDRDDSGQRAASPPAPTVASSTSPGTGPSSSPRTSSGSSSSSSSGGAARSFAGSGIDPASGARADVTIAPVGEASAVTVSVRGIPVGGRCRIVVHDDIGRSLEAGTWVVDSRYDDEPYVERVEVAPAAIERVELLDDVTGRRIVDVPIHEV
ncbi:MAG TPA: hypothetical protein VHN80_02115 [Kineosporiaceae bacterium]|nr:hypothetical protein [Kineosporiaceae bacterium]